MQCSVCIVSPAETKKTRVPGLLKGGFCNLCQLILFLFAAATLCLDFIKCCQDKVGWPYWILDNFFIEVIKPLRPHWGFISHGFVSLQMTANCPWRSSSPTSLTVSSLMSRCRSCITPSTGSKQSMLIFLLKISQLQLKPLLLTCCLALKINTSLQYLILKPNFDVEMPVCSTEERKENVEICQHLHVQLLYSWTTSNFPFVFPY